MSAEKQETIRSIFRSKMLPMLEKLEIPVAAHLESEIIAMIHLLTVAKEQFLAESGETDGGHLFYFESGIARCYVFDTDSNKYILSRILRKGDFFFDANAYLYGVPFAESVRMGESGMVLSITYSRLRSLLSEFTALYPLVIHFLALREKEHLAYQRLLKLPVEERVAAFLKDHQAIISRINNDHIATYLHMTRTTFSSAYAKYRAQPDGKH